MRIYESIETFQKPHKAIVAMGTFDGVHLGHRQLLRQLRTNAQEVGGEAVVVTFWPPPRLVLARIHPAPTQLLTTFDEKVAMLAHLGIDHLLKIQFTQTFSQLSAQDFIQQVLVVQVGMTRLVVGHDHRFGKDRAGNVALLQEAGLHYNFTIEAASSTMIDDVIINSTKIRQLLLEGNIEKAQAYLERPYEVNCSILQQELPHKSNLAIHLVSTHPRKLIPAEGLYSVQVVHQDVVDEGMLRIARKQDALTMELTMPRYSSTAWHASSLCIRFKKNLCQS